MKKTISFNSFMLNEQVTHLFKMRFLKGIILILNSHRLIWLSNSIQMSTNENLYIITLNPGDKSVIVTSENVEYFYCIRNCKKYVYIFRIYGCNRYSWL